MMILPPSSFRALHPVRAKIPVGADGSEITKTHQSKPNDGGDQVHDLKKAGEDEGGASVIPIHSRKVDGGSRRPLREGSVVWAGDGAEAEGDGKDQPCSAIEQKENFTIAADIIPISLELPVNEVFLSFSSSNISRCVGETFNITNPGNHPANFHWEMDQTALLGNSSTDARVVQLPPASVIMHGSYIKEGEGIQTDCLVHVPLETILASLSFLSQDPSRSEGRFSSLSPSTRPAERLRCC
ncbi:hypothetical protein BLNAU_14207 [Blattamonas nauphoetae]|uniref:Uncharacterized protein n=1 Tax=Blattamonas nauphoetae TaxID=2049346 RepID=A0ABQ9XL87_9EUKA|nr:hypothetical protein BLNAU_14207 [Blattamonas nauphoetae]